MRKTSGEIAQSITEAVGKAASWLPEGKDEAYRDYVRFRVADLKQLANALDAVLAAHEERHSDEFAVLDVGTSLGVVPLALKSMGIAAHACDHPAERHLRPWFEKEGIPYTSFDLMDGDLPYPDQTFNVVVFKDVIEHLVFSPKRTLQSFYRILKPGGRLFISTPNLSRLSSRVRLLLGRTVHPPLLEFFNSEFPFPGHHREYVLDEVITMLRLSGFEIVRAAYQQQNDIRQLLTLKRRFARNRFMQIRWRVILALAVWRPFALIMPSLAQEIVAVAEKPRRREHSLAAWPLSG
jgi:2-polyprenyl-3-methyl-5-hydroxy-6-metoxy-1,4-benzoquinol methylase